MKQVFIIGLSLIILLFSGVTGWAQSTSDTASKSPDSVTKSPDSIRKPPETITRTPASPIEQRAHQQSDAMRTKLNLTDDQYAKVDQINVTYAQKMAPIMQSPEGRFAKYRKLKPLMEEKDDKLRAVLTGDQYQQYEELKKQMRAQYKESMGN